LGKTLEIKGGEMDYYKCEKCGCTFDEFEMNYVAAETDKKCLCRKCRDKLKKKIKEGYE